MSPKEFTTLRLEVKGIIAQKDLDRRGERPKLLAALNKKLGREVNIKSLTMALTGYRKGEASAEILRTLKSILTCDFIHANNERIN